MARRRKAASVVGLDSRHEFPENTALIGRFLTFLSNRGKEVLAGGVFLGLVWPGLPAALSPYITVIVFLMLASAAVSVDWRDVARQGRRPAAPAAVIVWVLLVSPLLTVVVVTAIDMPPALATAIILMAAAPPVTAGIAFGLLLRLDMPIIVIPTFGATLLVPFTLPPMALALLGIELQIDLGEFILRLALLGGGGLAAGAGIRRVLGAARLQAFAPQLKGIPVFVLIVFAIAIMDGVTETWLARPDFVILTLAASFAANIALQLSGGLLFLWLGRRRALSAALVSGNRNMALLLAALSGAAEFDVALYFAIGQIPMYMLPAMLAPLYRRLLRD